MASLRLLRPSLLHHLGCNKSLSTEAVTAFQPSKVAVRTTESDPTNHSKEDIGKFYTMPKDVQNKLFRKKTLPLYFERLADTFNETNIIVRQPAIELFDYLKRANYDHPIIRYVIYGKFGCGKTMTLVHALNYAFNNEFLIVYIPSVWKWFHWSREIVSTERDPSLIDCPQDAAAWLKQFEITNADLITSLDLRMSKTYTWTAREKTEEGAPLLELVNHGINRVKYSCQVVEALLNEIKHHSTNKRCKTFVAIDGYNGFLQTYSRLKTSEGVGLSPYNNASLSKIFLSFVKNDWNNGAAVLILDDHAAMKGKTDSYLPFHLLTKVGIEMIDPFVPIHVPEYSELEFQNYLDYLEEMRWLQKPEGRDEIKFVTQRNPRTINTYCANR